MFNLMRIESFKLKRFTPFYVSLLFLGFVLVELLVKGLNPNAVAYWGYTCMHDGFVDGVQDCSLAFLFGMLIAWYVGIDFTERTIHRALTTGTKRWMIVVAKIMATSILTLIMHLLLILEDVIVYGRTFGFSLDGFVPRDLLWLGVVVLQLIAYNAFFVLISVICGNVYSALFACVAVSAICGNILRNFFTGFYVYEHSFFCFAKSSQNSDLIPCAICAIIALVILVAVTIVVFNKRDVAN